jgi:hypothetical protein
MLRNTSLLFIRDRPLVASKHKEQIRILLIKFARVQNMFYIYTMIFNKRKGVK